MSKRKNVEEQKIFNEIEAVVNSLPDDYKLKFGEKIKKKMRSDYYTQKRKDGIVKENERNQLRIKKFLILDDFYSKLIDTVAELKNKFYAVDDNFDIDSFLYEHYKTLLGRLERELNLLAKTRIIKNTFARLTILSKKWYENN